MISRLVLARNISKMDQFLMRYTKKMPQLYELYFCEDSFDELKKQVDTFMHRP